MNTRNLLIAVLGAALAGSFGIDAYGQSHVKVTKVKPDKNKPADAAPSAEPDKILYDRAMDDMKHGRYTEGRLSLQTLINSYPDSEYLAKAKLAVGDSYFKEGGTSNITQAIAEYKDFITFFPFLDEAAYAQMQVAMAHYRMMEKADRDPTQAQQAEDEFQAFLLKYPQNPLASQAEQRLREVQEVIGEGDYRIARFYYVKQDYRASAARLVEMTERYPLYSQSDEALWMLSSIYVRAKQVSKNEDDKNHWADLAAKCYDRIARDYPLSKLAPAAKSRLKEMGMPVPPPDPNALARMQKQQESDSSKHHQLAMLKLPLAMVKSNPDVTLAARSGQPNLNPPDDLVSATEVLKPGAAGPSFTLAVGGNGGAGGGGAGGQAVQMDTVQSSSDSESSTGLGVQTLATPDDPTAPGVSPAGATSTNSPDPNGTVAPTTETNPPAADGAHSETTPPSATSASPGDSKQPPDAKKDEKADPKTESTSKKKKGLKKLIPW
jgi:outer membrane protein assembly factor BamD